MKGWVAIAALLIGCFLVLAHRGVHGQNATTDESCYFGMGRVMLETHDWAVPCGRQHPPLSYYVNSLPLFFVPGPLSAGDGFQLLLCRLTSLVVFGLPLLLGVMLWAKDLYGRDGGLTALALASFSPTLLAHAPLITPDLPVTAAGFLSVYLFRRSGAGARGAVPWGLALGLALLAKGSAWLFVVCLILLAVLRAWRDRSGKPVRSALAGLAVAWLVVNVGYGFAGWLDWEGKAALLEKVPDRPLPRVAALSATPLLPLPYLQATASQLSVGSRGWPAFLMGEVRRSGWWYYFLVALLIKETLAFLLLLGVAAASLAWRRGDLLDEMTLLLPPALFLAAFSVATVQVGIRYVLPAFPFLFVFAARAVRLREIWKWPTRILLGGLLGWHAVSALRACPDFIAYFNELVGGPRNGYRYLVDSNLDWGQNRSRIEDHARRHGILVEPQVLPASGRVAVGATRFQGIFDGERYRLLRDEYDPVDQVGYNWLIFDLDQGRRFPRESIVPVLTGVSWVASTTPGEGWQTTAFPARGWPPARPVPAGLGSAFDASEEYPGTEAVPVRCAAEGAECALRTRFTLGRPAAQAILRFAASDRYRIYLNGRLVASRPQCPVRFAKEELSLASHLQTGANSLAVWTAACGAHAAGAIFGEMRVAQDRP